ncbi:hypothetical protein BGZ76_007532 [Entomortierella beljakovae]|nr:hypothetical protein BGZ76_007532 [Entomortierella beljakovae]
MRDVARTAKYTGLYLIGKTPRDQPFKIGVSTAALYPGIECLSIRQYRKFMKVVVGTVQLKDGIGTKPKKAKWAAKVEGEGWCGYWIPFQDQSKQSRNPSRSTPTTNPSNIPLGSGCDLLLLAVHGGGFIEGDALMFLEFFKRLMKQVQLEQNLMIGVLSIQYGLSPENPYPQAIDAVTASYCDLVLKYGVDPGRIMLAGDSAGGNICLGSYLKLQHNYSSLGLPAGAILISPWVRSTDHLQSSLFDVVSPIGCELYSEAYTRNDPEISTSQYTSPINAPTFAGLGPMLIAYGGLEILRPSIELFVDRARAEGIEVTTVLEEGRPHDYVLADILSTKKDRERVFQIVGEFVSNAYHRVGGAKGKNLLD